MNRLVRPRMACAPAANRSIKYHCPQGRLNARSGRTKGSQTTAPRLRKSLLLPGKTGNNPARNLHIYGQRGYEQQNPSPDNPQPDRIGFGFTGHPFRGLTRPRIGTPGHLEIGI